MSLEMVKVELLKLRKRRGLFWWSLLLTVGVPLVFFTVVEVLHLTSPEKYAAVGGIHGLENTLGALSTAGACAGILIGATAGSADVSSGAFRDLVSTGHSRWELFVARIPGVLSMIMPLTVAGFAVSSVFVLGFAGANVAVGSDVLIRSLGWALLATSVPALVALGLSSLADNRGTMIGVLIAWLFVGEPLIGGAATALGAAREGLLSLSLGRLDPVNKGAVPPDVHMGLVTAAVIVAVWIGATLYAGAVRTVRRDA
jgi:ABC-type transport system involved in multi-copper enzyme maturation permease subunit